VSLNTTHNIAAQVLDKTGYSLTAGSYSIRASSDQVVHASIVSPNTSVAATIASVTLTRAFAAFGGTTVSTNEPENRAMGRGRITASTTYTATRAGTAGDTVVTAHIEERV
jgi:hypothetical protein